MVNFFNFTLSRKLLNSNKYYIWKFPENEGEKGSSFWPIKTKSIEWILKIL